MNKDEKLIIQVLNAYKNGKIDFSKVPELEELVLKEVDTEFREYKNQLQSLTEKKINTTLQEIKIEAQEKLNILDIENLKIELLKDIQNEKKNLLALKRDIYKQKEQINVERHHKTLENYGLIIANIVCLLCFLVVGVLLGEWIYKGVWNGWGLHILYDTVSDMQPKHPYGALILGLGGFGLIALGIYSSFRLMYEASTTWLDQRPKIFEKIFTIKNKKKKIKFGKK